tara:strand:- start:59 stop:361 length:303 start_codon:yes stop_codon:yes gene_type:complete
VKASLLQAGLKIDERDLFSEPLDNHELANLMSGKDVSSYFSWRSPSFKKMGVDKEKLSRDDLIELMLAEPRLIRRPLIDTGSQLIVGTDKVAMCELMKQN